ncbi:PEP-CTERM sorting domain-containing protein [Rhodospirillaceae bacterium SYSU D60014]|uniref:PEP-CTERM sorting domain-containing protein n=1 Tax=Virgifigura deserti TaxID=2268457 RepID=UPI000E66A393
MRDTRILAAAVALVIIAPATAFAAPIIRSVGGSADPVSIEGTVNQFRADLGIPNNGNALGPLADGRREINWDGGGDAAPATQFPTPMETFNTAPVTRGGVFTTSGSGFEISGQPAPEFGDINPTYPGIFSTFSSPRLFTPLDSTRTDVLFFIPGTDTRALSSGFGAVFTDVDLADSTLMQFFDQNGGLLESLFVEEGTVADGSLSFLGVSFTEGAILSRVRITSGTTPLGAATNDDPANDIDLVVMDDFLYGEPQLAAQGVPEPSTLALLLAGLLPAALILWRRRLPHLSTG